MTIVRAIPPLRVFFWRIGRKLYCLARGEVQNDPRVNGEYWLLKLILGRSSRNVMLLDVGCNKGNWTAEALRLAMPGAAVQVHAFEPSAATREMLTRRLGAEESVKIHSYALSDSDGESLFYSSAEGAGTNSLSACSGDRAERVEIKTIDNFLSSEGIESVSMVKIDTEGFDLLVIKGAERMLVEGRCEVVQFEYNWRWLLNHASLRDVFMFIADKPYRLGKLVGSAIEFYEEWHFELDRYFENNYVLVKYGSELCALGAILHFSRSNTPIQRLNKPLLVK